MSILDAIYWEQQINIQEITNDDGKSHFPFSGVAL